MENEPVDARALANAVLDRADARGHKITNMALQKILYFGHGWFLAKNGRPLVNLRFEAWDYGPVIPILYRQFKVFGDDAITSRATEIDFETGNDVVVRPNVSSEVLRHVDLMVEFYAPKSGPALSSLSHEVGGPWHTVRFESNRVSSPIPNELIEAFFVEKLTSKKRRAHGYHA